MEKKNLSIFKILFLILFTSFILLPIHPASAETKTFETKQKVAKAYNRNINNLSATEWFERGYKLGKSGNNSDAVKAFSKAIELNPRYAKAYYNRGVVYGKLGNDQQAIKDYNKAIELDPRDASAYGNRGVSYHNLGNDQQAIADIKIAARLGHKKSQDFLKSEGIVW